MVAGKPTTMICDLGGQPQVVAFALDALLARHVPVTELIVLHFLPENKRIRHSLVGLAAEFVNGRCLFAAAGALVVLMKTVILAECCHAAIGGGKIRGYSEIVPNWFGCGVRRYG